MGTIPIFPVRTFKTRSRYSSGFTLIEILISLAIIVFVISIALPRLGRSFGTQMRATIRQIVSLNKELHHYARLKHKTYRLAIDFGDQQKPPRISVESSTGDELLLTEQQREDLDNRSFKSDKPQPSLFSGDSEVLKKPIELPKGVKFEDIELNNFKKPITEGRAYIHFFPSGLVQQAIIHIGNGDKLHWSLIVNPLTAKTDVMDGHVTLKDLGL